MKKSTYKIHEFDSIIYPTRLWVGINTPLEDLQEKFYALTDKDEVMDFDASILEFKSTCFATCFPVGEKKSGWKGVYCHIQRPKDLRAGVMAHEAEHFVCWLCKKLGIESTEFDDSEPRTYLIQWAVDCIEKVKLNKV